MKKLLKIIKKLIFAKNERKIIFLSFIIIFIEWTFPQLSLAKEIEINNPAPIKKEIVISGLNYESKIAERNNPFDIQLNSTKNEENPKEDVNKILPNDKPKRSLRVVITAYSSTPEETDDTPCITANGFNVCENNQENILAGNFLAFGTRVRLPELFGEQIFTVQDRMNPRYNRRLDIWMTSKERAKQFGIKNTLVEILD